MEDKAVQFIINTFNSNKSLEIWKCFLYNFIKSFKAKVCFRDGPNIIALYNIYRNQYNDLQYYKTY